MEPAPEVATGPRGARERWYGSMMSSPVGTPLAVGVVSVLLAVHACAPSPARRAAPPTDTSAAARPAPPTSSSAVIVASTATARASAKPSAPAPASGPTWRGDYCRSDAECGWDDPCLPARCGRGRVAPAAACDESAPAPGDCLCVEEMCTLRPRDPARGASADVSCVEPKDCAVDVATATCHPHGQSLIGPIYRQGPLCVCRPGMGRCELVWQQAVPCDSWRDCSWVHAPRLRPVPAKEVPRPVNRPVRPCQDGEVDSVCTEDGGRKTCQIVGWRC